MVGKILFRAAFGAPNSDLAYLNTRIRNKGSSLIVVMLVLVSQFCVVFEACLSSRCLGCGLQVWSS